MVFMKLLLQLCRNEFQNRKPSDLIILLSGRSVVMMMRMGGTNTDISSSKHCSNRETTTGCRDDRHEGTRQGSGGGGKETSPSSGGNWQFLLVYYWITNLKESCRHTNTFNASHPPNLCVNLRGPKHHHDVIIIISLLYVVQTANQRPEPTGSWTPVRSSGRVRTQI